MSEILNRNRESNLPTKKEMVSKISDELAGEGYKVVELNDEKPWGAYFRIDSNQSDAFIEKFFPGLTPIDARLGLEEAELSPKILLVSPGHRLSWQYHNRRAERWRFLTEGAYMKSDRDEETEVITADIDDVVQFNKSERHRLIASPNSYTIVAEIWQHTDSDQISDESDIIRIQDEYSR